MNAQASEAASEVDVPEVGVEELGYLLVEVSKLHRAQAHRALEELGLYRGQNFVLNALVEEEGLAQSELAEKLLVRPPTISNSLERMESAGWIERRTDPEDRRISRVYLTGAGKVLHRAVESLWTELETDTFAGLSLEEQRLLWGLLVRIRHNLRQATRSPGPLR